MDEEVPYKGGIWRNKRVKRSDLLESLLIKSDNQAAEALAESFNGGRDQFIVTMNQRAKSLGMLNTQFEDPSGLGKHNTSTAKDLSILVSKTYEHSEISSTSSSKFFKVEIKNKKKITYMTVGNTNSQLLKIFDNITLSKTGYTDPAGRCLALMVEKNSKKYVIIILGEKTSGDRFYRARNLINMVSE
jgi:D-alanyl-D-alanine endopeptidase (penicillin-binding protein 7)